jgi:Flp pilus assembly protein TadG
MRALRRLRACRAGSTSVEFAIICMALLLVTLGVIEFGRALYVRNQLSQAADCGDRVSLTGGAAADHGCGARLVLTLPVTDSEVQSAVRSAFTAGPANMLTVTIGAETVNGVHFRTIKLVYPFTPLIPQLSIGTINLSVDRRTPVV